MSFSDASDLFRTIVNVLASKFENNCIVLDTIVCVFSVFNFVVMFELLQTEIDISIIPYVRNHIRTIQN